MGSRRLSRLWGGTVTAPRNKDCGLGGGASEAFARLPWLPEWPPWRRGVHPAHRPLHLSLLRSLCFCPLLGCQILLLHPQLQIARSGFGIHVHDRAGHIGVCRKVSTCLPLACTVLAEGNRVANPEGHLAEIGPRTDLDTATSWLCDLWPVTNLSEPVCTQGKLGYLCLPSKMLGA